MTALAWSANGYQLLVAEAGKVWLHCAVRLPALTAPLLHDKWSGPAFMPDWTCSSAKLMCG